MSAEESTEHAETLDALKAKHGTIIVVEHDECGLLVFRKPTRIEWRKFKAERLEDGTKEIAVEKLVQRLVVHPSPQVFDTVLDDYPALADVLGNMIAEKVGVAKVEGKKY